MQLLLGPAAAACGREHRIHETLRPARVHMHALLRGAQERRDFELLLVVTVIEVELHGRCKA